MATTTIIYVAMVLAVFAVMSYSAHADDDFISRTCKKTKNAELCVDVLHQNIDSDDASSELDLANISLKIASATADLNVEYTKDWVRHSRHKPQRGALVACRLAYADAVNDLKLRAIPKFHSGDYAGAIKHVLAAKGAADACENAFKWIKLEPRQPS
ncbi:hypothetical protein CFC21_086050 [Triticum aestivum]|uniref:Pectinesterase inhibitor domain-containing protein n=2 Tax=Triticum aestivum TaxID=4565 RepID=A0A3B6PGD0_WHEAT|nr:hypothetical protein CFC21_086050 [Triticum aestivum]